MDSLKLPRLQGLGTYTSRPICGVTRFEERFCEKWYTE